MVAIFGDGWLPSLPSGWVLDRYLGDGWLPSSETVVALINWWPSWLTTLIVLWISWFPTDAHRLVAKLVDHPGFLLDR